MDHGNHYRSPLDRFKWTDKSMNVRLLSIGLCLLAGAFLITWIKTSIWTQIRDLQREFASINAERFSLGQQLQARAQGMYALLLTLHFQPNPATRSQILAAAQELAERLKSADSLVKSGGEVMALARVRAAHDRFLSRMGPALDDASADPIRRVFEETQIEFVTFAAAIQDLADAQSAASRTLVHDSERTLSRLQGWMKLSILLMWGLAISAAIFGYRGMVAPLRSKLNESLQIILRQEKLASLGVLATGVAHEIRNPLTAIKFRLFSLGNSMPGVGEHEDTKVIDGEINRLDRIVRDFLQFARPSEPELVNLPAEQIMQKVTDLLRGPLEKRGIQLRPPHPGSTWIQADSHQLEQVLINLVQNAAESIGQDGVVSMSIFAAHAQLRGRNVKVVIIEVTDSGKGIPPDVEKRLFDPFFTTKEGGTGLGLAIAARIVEKHGGILRYRTKLNEGTTFEVVLPKPDHD